MKYILPLFAFSFLLLQSCATDSQKAIEFNDAIIKEQSKIIELSLDLVETMDTDLAKCKDIRLDIVKQCDESLAAIKKLEGFEGSDRLKNAAIEPKRLIVFTDGYPCGSWGDPDYCDTTWIIHGDKNPNPPFGTYALYDDKVN